MKIAVLALTFDRVDMTIKTWVRNLKNAGVDFDLFWCDNGSALDNLRMVQEFMEREGIVTAWKTLYPENRGIAPAFNRMFREAFDVRGYDYACTMANDVLEPDNWLRLRIVAAQAIPNTGVVSIPVQRCARYGKRIENGIRIETGTIIGNWLITRACYDKLGGFCEDYGNYGPLDMDYCDRMKAANIRFYYLADYEADHIGKGELNPKPYQDAKLKSLREAWRHYDRNKKKYRNGKRIYQKNKEAGEEGNGGDEMAADGIKRT